MDDLTVSISQVPLAEAGPVNFHVNGKPKCRLALDCYDACTDGSPFCASQQQQLTRVIENDKLTFKILPRGPPYLTNKPFAWTDHTQFKKDDLYTISALAHALTSFDNKNIYVTDMEGVIHFGGIASTPFEIAISRFDGSRMFWTPIDYGMSFAKDLKVLEEAARQEEEGFDATRARGLLHKTYSNPPAGKARQTYGL